MRAALAGVLDVPVDRVSVKATRPEGLGLSRRRRRVPRARDAPMTRSRRPSAGRRAVVEAIRVGSRDGWCSSPPASVRRRACGPSSSRAASAGDRPVRDVDRVELDRLAPRSPRGRRATARRPRTPGRAGGARSGIVPVRRRRARGRPRRHHGSAEPRARLRDRPRLRAPRCWSRGPAAPADVTPAAIRASAGALLHLPHARVANIPRALGSTCRPQASPSSASTATRTTTIFDAAVSGRPRRAWSSAARARACRGWCVSDATSLVSLPMRGQVGSLNAVGIARGRPVRLRAPCRDVPERGYPPMMQPLPPRSRRAAASTRHGMGSGRTDRRACAAPTGHRRRRDPHRPRSDPGASPASS